MKCNGCGIDTRFTVGPSEFPGFDLLHCSNCGRGIQLVMQGPGRYRHKPFTEQDARRCLRRARRMP